MAVYSEKHKFIFFANPQTASKAISMTLRQALGAVSLPERELTRNGKVIVQAHHTTYDQLLDAGLLTREQLESLFKVTSIRNPYDQLVSKYLKYCERNGNDPAKYPWLKVGDAGNPENSFSPWVKWLSERYVEIDKIAKGPLAFIDHADHVIRFEALQEGFDEFMRKVGIPEPITIVSFNITKARSAEPSAEGQPAPKKKKKSYVEYYDEECRDIVTKLYEPILRRFDYKFGG